MKKVKISAILAALVITFAAPAIAGDHGGRGGGGGGGGHHVGGGGGGGWGGGGGHRPSGGGHVQRPSGGGGHVQRPDRGGGIGKWQGGGGQVHRPNRPNGGHVNRPDRGRDGGQVHRRPDGDRNWSHYRKEWRGPRHDFDRSDRRFYDRSHTWRGQYFEWWPWWVYSDPCLYAENQWRITGEPYWYDRWMACTGY